MRIVRRLFIAAAAAAGFIAIVAAPAAAKLASNHSEPLTGSR